MGKYVKKPIVIEAHQWFKNGDHPEDNVRVECVNADTGEEHYTNGKIVRPFANSQKSLSLSGTGVCSHCNNKMWKHGLIETLEGDHIVCPGDWIIKGIKGEYYPCKPDIFAETYDRVNND